MFTNQFFTSTSDNFIDMFNTKAAAHASCDALAEQVRKRKLSPARARPLSQKALKAVKTLDTVPHCWFGEHEVRYASEGSREDPSDSSIFRRPFAGLGRQSSEMHLIPGKQA